MNSGKGTNDGIFRINFNDGSRICYCSAGGEVTGVMYGDRKFNVQGKGTSIPMQLIVGQKPNTYLRKSSIILLKKDFFR